MSHLVDDLILVYFFFTLFLDKFSVAFDSLSFSTWYFLLLEFLWLFSCWVYYCIKLIDILIINNCSLWFWYLLLLTQIYIMGTVWHMCELSINTGFYSLLQKHCLQRWHTCLVFWLFSYWRCTETAPTLWWELWQFLWVSIYRFILVTKTERILLIVIHYWLINFLFLVFRRSLLLIESILKCYRLLLRLVYALRLRRWLLAMDIQLILMIFNLPRLVEILLNIDYLSRFIIDINQTILLFKKLRLQLSSSWFKS